MEHPGRAIDMEFFGALVTTPGQGSPGHRKIMLRERFPWMTSSDLAWLRMALKLYSGYRPKGKDLRVADREVSSSWASHFVGIKEKCIKGSRRVGLGVRVGFKPAHLNAAKTTPSPSTSWSHPDRAEHIPLTARAGARRAMTSGVDLWLRARFASGT